jgi:hypothetical protein
MNLLLFQDFLDNNDLWNPIFPDSRNINRKFLVFCKTNENFLSVFYIWDGKIPVFWKEFLKIVIEAPKSALFGPKIDNFLGRIRPKRFRWGNWGLCFCGPLCRYPVKLPDTGFRIVPESTVSVGNDVGTSMKDAMGTLLGFFLELAEIDRELDL